MSEKRILSVGQCMADHGSLTRTITSHFNAEIISASTAEQAKELLGEQSYDLILVNRIFDANGTSGLDFIREVKQGASPTGIPIMLVSNYSDAQEEAMKVGAIQGFGKAELQEDSTQERLAEILA